MTREEAIKVVKSATVYTPEEIEALETLIPGFTQSEDDRILNALITHIRIYEGDFTTVGVTKMEMLAYLERLKKPNARQRIAEWYKTEEGKAKYEEIANSMRKMIGEEQKPKQEDIDTEIGHWMSRLDDKYCMLVNHYSIQDIKDTAKHFAEWGAEHLKK